MGEDDGRTQIRERVGKTGVAAEDLILPGPKIDVAPGNRPDLNNCPQDKLTAAHDDCKNKLKVFIPPMSCLIDFCFGVQVSSIKARSFTRRSAMRTHSVFCIS